MGVSVAVVVVVLVIICLIIATTVVKKRKTNEKKMRRKRVSEYDTIATEEEERSRSAELGMETPSKKESRQDAEEVRELTNGDYLVVIENNRSEMCQTPVADYETPNTYETGGNTFEAMIHPAMTSYSNNFQNVEEDLREQTDNAELHKIFQYERDDPALKFDLTRLTFQEERFKLPKLRIGQGEKKPHKDNYRLRENEYF